MTRTSRRLGPPNPRRALRADRVTRSSRFLLVPMASRYSRLEASSSAWAASRSRPRLDDGFLHQVGLVPFLTMHVRLQSGGGLGPQSFDPGRPVAVAGVEFPDPRLLGREGGLDPGPAPGVAGLTALAEPLVQLVLAQQVSAGNLLLAAREFRDRFLERFQGFERFRDSENLTIIHNLFESFLRSFPTPR